MVKVRAFLLFLGPVAAFLPICTILLSSCKNYESERAEGWAAAAHITKKVCWVACQPPDWPQSTI